MYLRNCANFKSEFLSINFFTGMNMCPIQTWKLYTAKLNPNSTSLWQKPRQGLINNIDAYWYEDRNVGCDMLERFIKLSLAKSVTLEGYYTNHSI